MEDLGGVLASKVFLGTDNVPGWRAGAGIIAMVLS